VIQSFKHKGLRRLFEKGDARGLQPDQVNRIDLLLDALHNAESVDDLNLPGFGLHPLKGNRKNEPVVWAVKVNANDRITFEFEEGDAFHVNYIDYH